VTVRDWQLVNGMVAAWWASSWAVLLNDPRPAGSSRIVIALGLLGMVAQAVCVTALRSAKRQGVEASTGVGHDR